MTQHTEPRMRADWQGTLTLDGKVIGEVNPEHAEMIARAVNSHDALLQACCLATWLPKRKVSIAEVAARCEAAMQKAR